MPPAGVTAGKGLAVPTPVLPLSHKRAHLAGMLVTQSSASTAAQDNWQELALPSASPGTAMVTLPGRRADSVLTPWLPHGGQRQTLRLLISSSTTGPRGVNSSGLSAPLAEPSCCLFSPREDMHVVYFGKTAHFWHEPTLSPVLTCHLAPLHSGGLLFRLWRRLEAH